MTNAKLFIEEKYLYKKILSGEFDLAKIITHKLPLEQTSKAYK